MAKRTYALIAIMAALLLGTVAAASVMAPVADEPTADAGDYPEEVVRRLFDENGKVVTSDDRLAKIAREHEGSFGGYYFDRQNPNQVYVFMKDPSKTEAARSAFWAAYSGNRVVTQITPVQGDYAFDDLLAWSSVLDHAMARNGIYPATGGVFEIFNRILLGLDDMAQIEDIRSIMRDLDIPQGAVIFERADLELL